MRLLFVFVFLSSFAFGQQTAKQPNCADIVGFQESAIWESIKYKYKDYTGIIKKCFKNGKIEKFFNVKKGKQNGEARAWHENGQLEVEVNFKEGKPDGLMRAWHEDGQLEVEINFKEGKPDGLMRTWYKNGQLKKEENYKDDILISTKRYDEKGNILRND